jgi:hypothetical protein
MTRLGMTTNAEPTVASGSMAFGPTGHAPWRTEPKRPARFAIESSVHLLNAVTRRLAFSSPGPLRDRQSCNARDTEHGRAWPAVPIAARLARLD